MIKSKSVYVWLAVAAILSAPLAHSQVVISPDPDYVTTPALNDAGLTEIVTLATKGAVDKAVATQSVVNSTQSDVNAAQAVTNTKQAVTNTTQASINTAQGVINTAQGVTNAAQATVNTSQASLIALTGAQAKADVATETSRAKVAEASLQTTKVDRTELVSETAARNVADAAIRAEAFAQGAATAKSFAVVDSKIGGLQKDVASLQNSVKEVQEAAANSLAVSGIPTCSVGTCIGVGYGSTLGKQAIAIGFSSTYNSNTFKASVAGSGSSFGMSVGASHAF